jgi:hypothetical protein
MGQQRHAIADFWDDVLDRWTSGQNHLVGPLGRWMTSYKGAGKGAVDLDHYPDPYVGDLRGLAHDPRLVVLGLNPGIGYDQLQGPDGIWTRRIREQSYSGCFERSPAQDTASWIALHGRQSVYWNALLRFARRWLEDDKAGPSDILALELYPWHSASVTAPMQPPSELIEQYVWAAVSEIDVPVVFALGAPWFKNVEALGLPQVALFGKGGVPFVEPVNEAANWRVGVYELPSGQHVVVNSQSGNGQPPGPDRTPILQATLAPLLDAKPMSADLTFLSNQPGRINCDRCGRPASHLVAGGPLSNAPGRLLIYCGRCRDEATLAAVIPLEVVAQDPSAIVLSLYKAGLTSSDPDAVADKLPFASRDWVAAAHAVLRSRPE